MVTNNKLDNISKVNISKELIIRSFFCYCIAEIKFLYVKPKFGVVFYKIVFIKLSFLKDYIIIIRESKKSSAFI